MMYERIIRPLLFKIFSKDPEKAHEAVLTLLSFIGKQKWLAKLIEQFLTFEDAGLEQELYGLKFRNPVGLAAGFDKNGVALQGLQALGFGFIEAGTVTQYEQEGNPRPRIFRFPQDEAIINRMGFNNDGADKVSEHLRETRKLDIPLGISLGKSKITPLEKAVEDYLYSFRKLYSYGDYFIVNVSSPNTPGLRKLQEKRYLENLLSALQKENKILAKQIGCLRKRIWIKISPDIERDAIDEVVSVCFERGVVGLIAVNTTVTRDGLSMPTVEEGGLSGRPLRSKAISMTRYIHERTRGIIPIIGVGGIFTSEEAYEMLKYAHLIQIYTSFIYKGPAIVYQINKGLKQLMLRDGIKHISEIRRKR